MAYKQTHKDPRNKPMNFWSNIWWEPWMHREHYSLFSNGVGKLNSYMQKNELESPSYPQKWTCNELKT